MSFCPSFSFTSRFSATSMCTLMSRVSRTSRISTAAVQQLVQCVCGLGGRAVKTATQKTLFDNRMASQFSSSVWADSMMRKAALSAATTSKLLNEENRSESKGSKPRSPRQECTNGLRSKVSRRRLRGRRNRQTARALAQWVSKSGGLRRACVELRVAGSVGDCKKGWKAWGGVGVRVGPNTGWTGGVTERLERQERGGREGEREEGGVKGREKGGGGGGEGGGGGGSNYEVRDAIGYRLCAAAAVGRRGGRVGVFLSLLAA